MRWMSRAPTFLLRKGRVLEPRSKLRYRLLLLRSGRSMALAADELSVPLVLVRVLSLPFLTAIDFISWPIAARTLGRGPWWVVEVQLRDVEVDLVRVAEATDVDTARERRKELAAAAETRHLP